MYVGGNIVGFKIQTKSFYSTWAKERLKKWFDAAKLKKNVRIREQCKDKVTD